MEKIASDALVEQLKSESLKKPLAQYNNITVQACLNANPERVLIQETKNVIEELNIMCRIFSQQSRIVNDFSKCLRNMNADKRGVKAGITVSPPVQATSATVENPAPIYKDDYVPDETFRNADDVKDQILARKAMLDDLEESAQRRNDQASSTIETENCFPDIEFRSEAF